MLAIRKINNNVVICHDSNGRELFALGKGLGFGELPREVSLSQIDRTFYDVEASYQPLIQDIPTEILTFAAQIIDIARNQLSYELCPNSAITLADHIHFALERVKKGIKVKMPLAYDVEQTYPMEYRIGKNTLRRIQKEFLITLPEEEAVGIVFNLINNKLKPLDGGKTDAWKDDEMLEEITAIIENKLHIMVDYNSFNYSRFATHMQYLFKRIHAGKAIESDNIQLSQALKEQFSEVADCVENIVEHIRSKWNCELSEEEKLYIMLHINRICLIEGL